MIDPLAEAQRLIDEKRSVYFSSGLSSSTNGKIFFTIWGKPSDKILAQGYGHTVPEAARDALSKLETPNPTFSLPEIQTQPLFPEMTR